MTAEVQQQSPADIAQASAVAAADGGDGQQENQEQVGAWSAESPSAVLPGVLTACPPTVVRAAGDHPLGCVRWRRRQGGL